MDTKPTIKNFLVVILPSLLTVFIIFFLIMPQVRENRKDINQYTLPASQKISTNKSMKEANSSYIDISVQDAKELLNQNSDIIVIDVSPNYDKGHLPGAINYYVGDGSLDQAIPSLDKQATYLVYCHVDSAAILGATKLIEAGFENVYRLKGNYSAWVNAGYPIEL